MLKVLMPELYYKVYVLYLLQMLDIAATTMLKRMINICSCWTAGNADNHFTWQGALMPASMMLSTPSPRSDFGQLNCQVQYCAFHNLLTVSAPG